MKMKLYLGLILCAMMQPIAAQKIPSTKLSDLKVRYQQLMKSPIKNEQAIREILKQVRTADPSWADDRLTEYEFLLSQKSGSTYKEPRLLPGVPTPREYMPKPEPEMPAAPEEAYYERVPAGEPASSEKPAVNPPEYGLPAYGEEKLYEEKPVENPPAYEQVAVASKKRVTKKIAHHDKRQDHQPRSRS